MIEGCGLLFTPQGERLLQPLSVPPGQPAPRDVAERPFPPARAREEPGQGPWQGGVRPAHPEGSQPGTRARVPSETGLGNPDSRPALFRAQTAFGSCPTC